MLAKVYKHLNWKDWKQGHHIDHHLGRLHQRRQDPIYCPPEWLVGQAEGRSNINGRDNELRFWVAADEIDSVKPHSPDAQNPIWNTLDVYFMAARFEPGPSPQKVKNATATVFLNGVKIQDRVGVPRGTGSRQKKNEATGQGLVSLIDAESGLKKQAGPIRFQEHGNPVQYRNIEINPNWSPAATGWQRSTFPQSVSLSETSATNDGKIKLIITSSVIQSLGIGNVTPWLTWHNDSWKPGVDDIEPIPVYAIISYPAPDKMECEFDLTNKRVGDWNVELWGPGQPRVVLDRKAFTINAP